MSDGAHAALLLREVVRSASGGGNVATVNPCWLLSSPQRAPSEDDFAFFREVLGGVAALDPAALAAAEALLRVADVSPGRTLLSLGDSPDLVGLVRTGVVREFYLGPDATERTRAFCLPGDFFGSLADALSGRPARCFVKTEETSRVLFTRWSEYVELEDRFPAWVSVTRRTVEQLYLRKAEREYELLALDATTRYLALLARSPGLDQRVSQQLIASYLGITPVHLSRIRRQIRDLNPG